MSSSVYNATFSSFPPQQYGVVESSVSPSYAPQMEQIVQAVALPLLLSEGIPLVQQIVGKGLVVAGQLWSKLPSVSQTCSKINTYFRDFLSLPGAQAASVSPPQEKTEVPILNCSAPIPSSYIGTYLSSLNFDDQGNLMAVLGNDKSLDAILLPAGSNQWQLPQGLSPDEDYDSSVGNAHGDVFVTWWPHDSASCSQSIYSSGSWSPSVSVSCDFVTAFSLFPFNSHVMAAHYADSKVQVADIVGGNWGPFVTIGDSTINDLLARPLVAADNQGNAIAAWLSNDRTLQVSWRPPGGSWTKPETLFTFQANVTAVTSKFDLAMSDWGDVAVVFSTTCNGCNMTVQAVSRPFNGSWSPQYTLDNCMPGTYCNANVGSSLKISRKGDVVIFQSGATNAMFLSSPVGSAIVPLILNATYFPDTNIVDIDSLGNVFLFLTYPYSGNFVQICSWISGKCSPPTYFPESYGGIYPMLNAQGKMIVPVKRTPPPVFSLTTYRCDIVDSETV